MTLDDIWTAITAEQLRARQLHGGLAVGANHPHDHLRAVVLTEEVGEVASAVQADDRDQLRTELAQVAAVAVAWLRLL